MNVVFVIVIFILLWVLSIIHRERRKAMRSGYYDRVTDEHFYKGHWTSNYWNEKAEFEALEDIYKELEYEKMIEQREWEDEEFRHGESMLDRYSEDEHDR